MHIHKPEWVAHEGQPIFSVDVHPDGTRFATAGQDNLVKVWALGPVIDQARATCAHTVHWALMTDGGPFLVSAVSTAPHGRAARPCLADAITSVHPESQALENDDANPQLLATLSGHLGAVNCARWSPDGTVLASGSDDQLVMLWSIAGGNELLASVPFGSKHKPNVERWRCASTLRGHTGDITDVAWAPHASQLASVSLDNSVRPPPSTARATCLVHTAYR